MVTSSSYVTCTGPCSIQEFDDPLGVVFHGDEDDAVVALAYGVTGGAIFLEGFGGISPEIGEVGGGALGAGVPAFSGVPWVLLMEVFLVKPSPRVSPEVTEGARLVPLPGDGLR